MSSTAPDHAAPLRAEPTVVRELTEKDHPRWDRFVSEQAGGTFYHLSGWQQVIEGFLGHRTFYLYSAQGDQIDGVLPLAQVKSLLFGNALISLPFLVYGGPVTANEKSLELLLARAVELAEKLGVDYLELRNRSPVTDWPAKDRYVTFRKSISSEPSENLAAIPRKQRAMIRKGQKLGLKGVQDDGTDRLYDVLSECKRNLGTPFFSRRYLVSIARTFPDSCEVMTVEHGTDAVASVMSFRFRDEILPYYGGGGVKARQLYANDFLYWSVMEQAALDGIRVFDYGRSQKDTGPYRFKKHWGFEPEPLSYEFHLVKARELPQLDPSNARYKRAIQTWARLPLPVARLLGPPIARRIG